MIILFKFCNRLQCIFYNDFKPLIKCFFLDLAELFSHYKLQKWIRKPLF